jgi:recombinational DNA repair ATPase RecF
MLGEEGLITAYHLKHFRSYWEATLPLAPLTLLIGANASGKSNALEGLRRLSRMARAHTGRTSSGPGADY